MDLPEALSTALRAADENYRRSDGETGRRTAAWAPAAGPASPRDRPAAPENPASMDLPEALSTALRAADENYLTGLCNKGTVNRAKKDLAGLTDPELIPENGGVTVKLAVGEGNQGLAVAHSPGNVSPAAKLDAHKDFHRVPRGAGADGAQPGPFRDRLGPEAYDEGPGAGHRPAHRPTGRCPADRENAAGYPPLRPGQAGPQQPQQCAFPAQPGYFPHHPEKSGPL